MTNSPNEGELSESAIRFFQSMRQVFCWMDDALNRFQCELTALPELRQKFSTLEDVPIDIGGRLEKIKAEIKAFEQDLRKSKRQMRWDQRQHSKHILSTGLPLSEQANLKSINAKFVTVTDQVQARATAIAKTLDAQTKDQADPMWDFEMNSTFHFVLKEDDPGYSDDSDNFLATRELCLHRAEGDSARQEFIGPDWPDGYELDLMPHGILFHELHCRGSAFSESPRQNLKDIQRIGDVWINLVVQFQFYYDVIQGKWVKAFHTQGEDNVRVYAQERTAP